MGCQDKDENHSISNQNCGDPNQRRHEMTSRRDGSDEKRRKGEGNVNHEGGSSTSNEGNSNSSSKGSNNSNNNNGFAKGYSYSCSGLLMYSSDMQGKDKRPVCLGISGKWKEGAIPKQDIQRLEADPFAGDEEIMKARSENSSVPSASAGARSSPISRRLSSTSSPGAASSAKDKNQRQPPSFGKRPTKEDFNYGCLGYSRVILRSLEETSGTNSKKEDGQSNNESIWDALGGKLKKPPASVIGMPHCIMGVNIIQASPAKEGSRNIPKHSIPSRNNQQQSDHVADSHPKRRGQRTVDDIFNEFSQNLSKKEDDAAKAPRKDAAVSREKSNDNQSKQHEKQQSNAPEKKKTVDDILDEFNRVLGGGRTKSSDDILDDFDRAMGGGQTKSADTVKSSHDQGQHKKIDEKSVNEDDKNLNDENLDRDIEALRKRTQQALSSNETDPRTWKQRELDAETRRKILEERRRVQQQRIQALRERERRLREMERKRQEQLAAMQRRQDQEGIALPFGLTFEKLKTYMIKTAIKTKDKMYENGIFMTKELTRTDLPSRVVASSRRIVDQFGPTSDLVSKALGRCRTEVQKAIDYIKRGGSGQ